MTAPRNFSYFSGKRLHLGVCGSIAAYKAIELMRLFQKTGIHVSVTITEAGARFVAPLSFEALDADVVYSGMFTNEDGTSFGHLTPGSVADAFVIAPATAAAMARLACGSADEILAAQTLAFLGPVVIAPAMNPRMWRNPATQANVNTLRERGYSFVFPNAGPVACGDVGDGRLAELRDIYLAGLKALSPQDLAGKRIMVTLGPTREMWDGVRCWTNLSTGRMGAALVETAFLRGAEVVAVAGPGVPELPAGVERRDVVSAAEMFEVANHYWGNSDIGVFCAAVADFHPIAQGVGKFKKRHAGETITVTFGANPDILATLSARRNNRQKVVGFAAETGDLEAYVAEKLERKKADMIVGNLVGTAGSGFEGALNTVFIQDTQGRSEALPTQSKTDVAWRIFDWLLTL